jgi:hypothetical protein
VRALAGGVAGAVGLVLVASAGGCAVVWAALSLAAEELLTRPPIGPTFQFFYLAILVLGVPVGAVGGAWLGSGRLGAVRWPAALLAGLAAACAGTFLGMLIGRLLFWAIQAVAVGASPFFATAHAERDSFFALGGVVAVWGFALGFGLLARARHPGLFLTLLLAAAALSPFALYLLIRAPRS